MDEEAQREDAMRWSGSLKESLVAEVFSVQSMVASRATLTSTYQAVVDGALRLLDAEAGSLRFVDHEDPSWMVAVAWSGSAGDGERWRHRAPISEGLSGQVISTGRVVALDDGPSPRARSQLAPVTARALVGAPIREQTRVVGSIVVGSTQASRRWTPSDREVLATYAQHVGVALLVARRDHAAHEAYLDALTGLGNRGLLVDRLQHELVRADRGATAPTLLYLDLDHFKAVNDTFGHLAGDQLLRAVAERLVNCVREEDVCARLGGDEFAVLLGAGADPPAVARRVLASLRRPFAIAGSEVSVSVSIGIATGTDEAETLLRNADRAMYDAKRTGGGRFEYHPPSPPETLRVSRSA